MGFTDLVWISGSLVNQNLTDWITFYSYLIYTHHLFPSPSSNKCKLVSIHVTLTARRTFLFWSFIHYS